MLTYGESPDADVRLSGEVHRGLAWSAVVTMDGGRSTGCGCSSPATTTSSTRPPRSSRPPPGSARTRSRCWPGWRPSRGTRRRFEPKGRAAGVQVVDDYAHNPGKVAAVVGTATQLVADAGSGRLVVVFQPHLYSRTRDFAGELGAGARRRPTSSSSWTCTRAREDPAAGRLGSASVAEAVRAARADADVRYVPSWAAVPRQWSPDCSGPATCSSPWGPAT